MGSSSTLLYSRQHCAVRGFAFRLTALVWLFRSRTAQFCLNAASQDCYRLRPFDCVLRGSLQQRSFAGLIQAAAFWLLVVGELTAALICRIVTGCGVLTVCCGGACSSVDLQDCYRPRHVDCLLWGSLQQRQFAGLLQAAAC
jgi:hypothetical protein